METDIQAFYTPPFKARSKRDDLVRDASLNPASPAQAQYSAVAGAKPPQLAGALTQGSTAAGHLMVAR